MTDTPTETFLGVLADLDAKREAAYLEVFGLCDGSREWTMRVPVQENRDSDTVIVAGLDAGDRAAVALRQVLAKHSPVEWQECDADGVPDLTKPLPPFCRECSPQEYVEAVEFGDTIDQGADVVGYPCGTVQAIEAALRSPTRRPGASERRASWRGHADTCGACAP